MQSTDDLLASSMKGVVNSLRERAEFSAAVKLAKDLFRWTTGQDKNCPWWKAWVDQLSRASTSISINMAEGLGRASRAQVVQFYRVARGSAWECLALLLVSNWDVPDELLAGARTVCELIDSAIKEMVA